jgi:hypothetical protein
MAALGQQLLVQTTPLETAMQSESETHERSYDDRSIATQKFWPTA